MRMSNIETLVDNSKCLESFGRSVVDIDIEEASSTVPKSRESKRTL